ncbi:L-galactose dehydrogenase [Ixodes scapularis]
MDVILQETLPALETLRQAGITRYIGVTGYPLQTLRELIERSPVKIDIVLSYCRGTLFDQTLREYMPFFQGRGVGVANAAPLGMGLLTRGPPPRWHPATDELKDACARAYAFCQESGVSLEKLGLGYSLYKFPGVHTTIVGMNSPDTLEKNIANMNVTKDEEVTADLVQRKFFQPLSIHHWEGREVEKDADSAARWFGFTVLLQAPPARRLSLAAATATPRRSVDERAARGGACFFRCCCDPAPMDEAREDRSSPLAPFPSSLNAVRAGAAAAAAAC